jgi:hypothetical protein
MSDFRFEFKVATTLEGGVSITPTVPGAEAPEPTPVEREATIFDIVDTARKLVADLERQILLDAVNSIVTSVIPEPDVTVPEQVKQALDKRNKAKEAEQN